MRTYLDFESKKWVSEKPKKYWTGLVCELTGEKIFTGDIISYIYVYIYAQLQIMTFSYIFFKRIAVTLRIN